MILTLLFLLISTAAFSSDKAETLGVTKAPAPISSNFSKIANPIPNWSKLPKVELPLFPVYGEGCGDSVKAFISIFNPTKLKEQALEAALREKLPTNSSHSYMRGYVEGKIVEDIFNQLGISNDSTIYSRSFAGTDVHTFKRDHVKKLQIRPGLEMFGTIAIHTPIKSNAEYKNAGLRCSPEYDPHENYIPLGLAWIGNEDPFAKNEIKEVKWENSRPLSKDKQLGEISRYWQKYHEGRKVEDPTASYANLGDWKLIQIQLQSYSKSSGAAETLGYFLKKNDQIHTVRDFYLTSDYKNKPEKIFSGKLFNSYQHVVVFSSMGMGECGKLLLLKEDATWVETELYCGQWG